MQTIWKFYLGISIKKCDAQKLGWISDHFEIISRYVNSELWCTKNLENFEWNAQCFYKIDGEKVPSVDEFDDGQSTRIYPSKYYERP